ncbi:MAG: hypothetical protein HYT79_11350 [Elusimicrobia bacterium]|nr:hypothetical protein [Elusimicrobiota bacterium]
MRLSNAMKLAFIRLGTLLAAGALGVPAAMAAGEEAQVIQPMTAILQKVSMVVGVVVLFIGLIYGFAAYGTGDEDKMKTARNAFIGGILILMVFPIVKIILAAVGYGNLLRGV